MSQTWLHFALGFPIVSSLAQHEIPIQHNEDSQHLVGLHNLFTIVFSLSTTLPYFEKILGPVYVKVVDPR